MYQTASERSINVAFTNAAVLIHLFESKRWVSYTDIQEQLGCCKRTAYRYVRSMETAGFVLKRDHVGRTQYYSLVKSPDCARIAPHFTKGISPECTTAPIITGTK
jgi:predicted transcriptional regulator